MTENVPATCVLCALALLIFILKVYRIALLGPSPRYHISKPELLLHVFGLMILFIQILFHVLSPGSQWLWAGRLAGVRAQLIVWGLNMLLILKNVKHISSMPVGLSIVLMIGLCAMNVYFICKDQMLSQTIALWIFGVVPHIRIALQELRGEDENTHEREGGGLALKVLGDPFHPYTKPEEYFKASGEWLGLTGILAWTISYNFNYDLFLDNPLRDRVGYNNVCVGWDAPPALYLTAPFAAVYSYLGLRYTWTNIQRTSLLRVHLSRSQFVCSIVADVVFGIAIANFPTLLVVTPAVSANAHTCLFLFSIVCRVFVLWAHWMENYDNVTKSSWIYLVIFSIMSIGYSTMIIVSLEMYDQQVAKGISKPEPFFHPWIMMTLDYTWFTAAVLVNKFWPKSGYIIHSKLHVEYPVESPATEMDSPAAEMIGLGTAREESVEQ